MQSFYFYDLETSGFSPRNARIMQFAGQRTDMALKPIGRPDNLLIKLTADCLPEPGAVLTHGITPQKTLAEGASEAEFLRRFFEKINQPNTIMVGYNNIRFDDEFMRFTMWRNFYDAYEWQWKDNCSKWDLIDVVRMTRALRPAGIEWPYAPDGKPTVGLEKLAAVNKLQHDSAHDALSDVRAAIAVAQLIKQKQPKLFDWLLKMRDKKNNTPFVESSEAFVYTSGRYSGEFLKTTAVVKVALHPGGRGSFVFDLRVDPNSYLKMSAKELVKLWKDSLTYKKEVAERTYFPLKLLAYNKCPAIAPLSVLDKDSQKRLQLDLADIKANLAKIRAAIGFEKRILEAHELIEPKKQPKMIIDEQQVDSQLYDGFVPKHDTPKMSMVRAAGADEIAALQVDFEDERLQALLPIYKARNFLAKLEPSQVKWWEEFRAHRLLDGGENSQAARFFNQLETFSQNSSLTQDQKYLLEEVKLYAESVIPAP